MADVKIRKLPEWVVDYHKRNAKLAGRSLEEELRVLITDQIMEKRRYWSRRLAKSREAIRKRHGTLPNLVILARDERERQR